MGKSIEIESRLVALREKEKCGVITKHHQGFFRMGEGEGDENVLELNSGDGCAILWVHRKRMNYIV